MPDELVDVVPVKQIASAAFWKASWNDGGTKAMNDMSKQASKFQQPNRERNNSPGSNAAKLARYYVLLRATLGQQQTSDHEDVAPSASQTDRNWRTS